MLRSFLLHLIPLLLPFIVYGAYLYFSRRAVAAGLREGPLVWLTAAGLLLMIVSFIVLGLVSGEDKEGQYIPPRFEGGRIVPSQVR